MVEIDGQIAQLLVVARGHDVADVAFVANEHDAAAVDLRHLGDAPHDREEDVAEVEARRERLRELEHHLGVALLRASASMYSRMRSCPRMRATSSAGRNGLRTKSSAPEANARATSSSPSSRVSTTTGTSRRPGRASDGAQDRVAVGRGHHQIEEHQRREPLREIHARASAPEVASHFESAETHELRTSTRRRRAVVVDHQDRRAWSRIQG